uniref:Uncharacterized protein n=1 Tax=Angiostrongylus cantonensis TaxID=6313 RepID=A0A0K0DK36_ANGCA
MEEDLLNLEHDDPTKRPRCLPLPPPYHLLPNTSFFRKTSIKPPPIYCSDGLPPLKRIINRYVASILVDHMRLEEELQIFLQENREIFSGLGTTQKEMKEEDEGSTEKEKTAQGEQPLDVQNRQARRSHVVLKNLLYGGQLTHYIQDGDEFPSIPGYLYNLPLTNSNVKISHEIGVKESTDYQQQNTTQDLHFPPLRTLREEWPADLPPVVPEYATTSPVISLQEDHSPVKSTAPQTADEIVDIDGCEEAAPEFSVIATERYASITITQSTLNLQFAERRECQSTV